MRPSTAETASWLNTLKSEGNIQNKVFALDVNTNYGVHNRDKTADPLTGTLEVGGWSNTYGSDGDLTLFQTDSDTWTIPVSHVNFDGADYEYPVDAFIMPNYPFISFDTENWGAFSAAFAAKYTAWTCTDSGSWRYCSKPVESDGTCDVSDISGAKVGLKYKGVFGEFTVQIRLDDKVLLSDDISTSSS